MTDSTATASTAATLTTQRSHDVRTISLVGVAHGTSHFFHLLLPSLFPFLAQDFHLSFAQLGLLTTVFFIVSGIGQALSGFWVDRYGATRILSIGLSAFAIGALIASQAQGYASLLLSAAALGAGNAVFHPVDYTIINRRVSGPRLGHAYSTHGISGNLGWAAAPLFCLSIAGVTGSWRYATLGAAIFAISMLVIVRWRNTDLFVSPTWKPNASPTNENSATEQDDKHGLAFMKLPQVWLCFGFFFMSAIALGAIQNFAVPALKVLFAMPLEQATLTLSAYLVSGAVGMFAGGFVAARAAHAEKTVMIGLGISILLLLLLQYAQNTLAIFTILPSILLAVSGFGVGIANPSRDLLIKRATPVGSTGRVYGTVYSGLDVGLALSPLLLGLAMDAGKPQAVFLLAAAGLALAVMLALAIGKYTKAK